MNASSAAVASSTSAKSPRAFWEHLWRQSGINFVLFVVIGFLKSSPLGECHDGDECSDNYKKPDLHNAMPFSEDFAGGGSAHRGGWCGGRSVQC